MLDDEINSRGLHEYRSGKALLDGRATRSGASNMNHDEDILTTD